MEFLQRSIIPLHGVSAMADSVPPNAETAEVQKVTGGNISAQCESRRVAAIRKKAARVGDEPASKLWPAFFWCGGLRPCLSVFSK